jgi:hypothetical protein
MVQTGWTNSTFDFQHSIARAISLYLWHLVRVKFIRHFLGSWCFIGYSERALSSFKYFRICCVFISCWWDLRYYRYIIAVILGGMALVFLRNGDRSVLLFPESSDEAAARNWPGDVYWSAGVSGCKEIAFLGITIIDMHGCYFRWVKCLWVQTLHRPLYHSGFKRSAKLLSSVESSVTYIDFIHQCS